MGNRLQVARYLQEVGAHFVRYFQGACQQPGQFRRRLAFVRLDLANHRGRAADPLGQRGLTPIPRPALPAQPIAKGMNLCAAHLIVHPINLQHERLLRQIVPHSVTRIVTHPVTNGKRKTHILAAPEVSSNSLRRMTYEQHCWDLEDVNCAV